ncbi:GNAT family N-acetyltransferase [Inhella inkyongensis]|uniref:GNAT family N-acetyltransferase n=1 Tax=Inhella inkyongensis TaxID=392593 RepID=UPI001FE82E0B|nr:GNAT family N-acetyltransferase [Inhella inkyongensis]
MMQLEVLDHWPDGLAQAWDALLVTQDAPTVFSSARWLQAWVETGCAAPEAGWRLRLFVLREQGELKAACAGWLKSHSWGEFVFDQAWARAYQHHGLAYYPKLVLALPFTPVPGSRLLATDEGVRGELLWAVQDWAGQQGLSGTHLLFGSPADARAAQLADQLAHGASGWVRRQQSQFHWQRDAAWHSMDDFLGALRADKRKKILQERRRVREAGVRVDFLAGAQASPQEWAWAYRCYAQTYGERGQQPYLTPEFFQRTRSDWWLARAWLADQTIACALLVEDQGVLYGRHWGALHSVPFLHFELCYYAPLEWALQRGLHRFEGGAQGAHKLARGFMPVSTFSLHALHDPRFAAALQSFGEEEQAAVAAYEEELLAHAPFRAG